MMNRRNFLRAVGGMSLPVAGSRLFAQPKGSPSENQATRGAQPFEINSGPQLFLDDYLIDRMERLERQVQQPQRLAKPILDSKTFGVTQPYLTVLHDHE